MVSIIPSIGQFDREKSTVARKLGSQKARMLGSWEAIDLKDQGKRFKDKGETAQRLGCLAAGQRSTSFEC